MGNNVKILNYDFLDSNPDSFGTVLSNDAIPNFSDEGLYDSIVKNHHDWRMTDAFCKMHCNCIEWLPVSDKDNVLKIGEDNGNALELVASKAKAVTCIETSLKRCELIASRTAYCDNVTVALAGIDDIAEYGWQKFDYIIMVGSFSHIEDYFSEDTGKTITRTEALKKIKSLLAPHGIVVIADDNRLGLKYWNGVKPDGDDSSFAILENGCSKNGQRFHSKNEYCRFIREAGFGNYRFYYPYPDYKYTTAVYSDRRLPQQGDLNNDIYNWEEYCLNLYKDSDVYNVILNEELFDRMSNSFVILMSEDNDFDEFDTIYVKYSNDRSGNYKIKTEIRQNSEGEKSVYKVPMNKFVIRHLRKMQDFYDMFKAKNPPDSKFALNRCSFDGTEIKCEYINGVSLADSVSNLIDEGKTDEVRAVFKELYNFLAEYTADNSGDKESDKKIPAYFMETDRFHNVFGPVKLPWELVRAKYSNIDLILQNIIVTPDGKWNVIDYEWTYDFSVPVLYLIWRSVFYLRREVSGLPGSNDKWRDELYAEFNIDNELQKEFLKMEESFQSYITRGVLPLRLMSKKPGNINIIRKPIEYFLDLGDGFDSDNNVRSDCEIHPDGYFRLEIPLNYNEAKRIRIDPDTQKCIVKVISATNGYGIDVPYQTNAEREIEEGCYAFLSNDPQIIVEETDMLVDKLVVEGLLYPVPDNFI